MNILKGITYVSIVAVSTTWTVVGILLIKKSHLLNEFKEEADKNIKGATDKISMVADRINKITDRIFKGSE